jgi:NSS family neurotransmitter:Na+ symporter
MVTYGSHIGRNTNVVSNSRYIVHTDTIVALLAGVLIIPLFSISGKVGLDPSLVFISLVDTFYGFGDPWGRIIGTSFFALFNFAIVTSTISLLEPTVNYLAKGRKLRRKYFSVLIGSGIFLISIPAILSFNPESNPAFTNFLGYGNKGDGTMGYFNFILDFFGTFCLLAGAFVFSMFINYKWSIEKLIEELTVPGFCPDNQVRKMLRVTILWAIPILMSLLFLGECVKMMYKLGMLA